MIVGDVLAKLALGPSYIEQLNGTGSRPPILIDLPTTRSPQPAEPTTPETLES